MRFHPASTVSLVVLSMLSVTACGGGVLDGPEDVGVAAGGAGSSGASGSQATAGKAGASGSAAGAAGQGGSGGGAAGKAGSAGGTAGVGGSSGSAGTAGSGKGGTGGTAGTAGQGGTSAAGTSAQGGAGQAGTSAQGGTSTAGTSAQGGTSTAGTSAQGGTSTAGTSAQGGAGQAGSSSAGAAGDAGQAGAAGSSSGTCTDGLKNGAESDVDCGGGCGPCADGLACGGPADCSSGVCSVTCQAATCADGVKNGAETGIDCGGGTCAGCADGGACNGADDCDSRLCAGSQCAQPSAVLEGPGGEGVWLDATHVYWAVRGNGSNGQIWRAALDGTGAVAVASNLAKPTTVTTDATNVYFSSYGEGAASYLSSMPKDLSASPTKLLDLAPFSYGVMFNADDGFLYYTEHVGGNLGVGSIGRLDLGTMMTTTVATNQSGRLYALARAGTTLYAASVDASALYSYDLASIPASPTTVTSGGFGYPINLAVDAKYVYVQDANVSTVFRVTLDGSMTDSVVTCGNGVAGGVAVNQGAIYLTCPDGLHIVPKP